MATAESKDILLLRLEAPLLSFGGHAVDERRVCREMPGQAMLTGLLANALGWHHRDGEALDGLQRRLTYAVREDRRGERLKDFQTVDLGQDFLQRGWTTYGSPEGRGGASSGGTHIRLSDYLANAAYTVALCLDPADQSPSLDDLEGALRHPARPLFLGRKACLPSRPLLGHRRQTHRLRAPSPLAALAVTPPWAEDGPPSCRVWWPGGPTATTAADRHTVEVPEGISYHRNLPVVDERLWEQQLHAGTRHLHVGYLHLATHEPAAPGDAHA